MAETKDRKLSFRERKGTDSVAVYVTAYDPSKKRGVQKVLGSFPRYAVVHRGAAGIPDDSRLAQNLAPTELKQVDAWAKQKRAEREASSLQFAAHHGITSTLENFVKALEAGAFDENQIETQRIHELLDDARKAMNKHGLKRPQKARQTAKTLPGQQTLSST
jgi:hypothetical protein